jgi:hypothetical protein
MNFHPFLQIVLYCSAMPELSFLPSVDSDLLIFLFVFEQPLSAFPYAAGRHRMD